jgi:N-acetylneuraminic acid mutarotase
MRNRIKAIGVLALFLVSLLLPTTGALAADTTASWTAKASMSTTREFFQTEVIDGKIYAFGGQSNSSVLSSVEVYDPSTNTWTTLASMSTARVDFQTEVIDGKIYAIGGYKYINSTYEYLSSVEVYDPSTNAWTTLPSMSTARYSFQTQVIDGKIFAIGGISSSNIVLSSLSSAEVYDPTLKTWTTLSSMSTTRQYFKTGVIDGKIIAIGGMSKATTLSSAEIYNPATNKWTAIASMSMSRMYLQAQVINGKVYAMGGSAGSGGESTEVYDPSLNTWTTLPSMTTARENFQSEVINNRIYAMGGTNASYLASVEAYTAVSTITAPTLTATAGDSQVNLSWTAVDNASSYNVYRSTTSGGPYTKIATGVTGTTYNDTDVTNGTTYYYVVTAVNSSGTESAYSNEASATPKSTGKALLRITMTNGEEKEYDMSTDQMRLFVKWYNNGTDKQVYTIKKTFNIGKLSDRTEYLVHSKIAFFETMAYNTTSTATTTTTSKTALLKVVLSTGDIKEYEVTADQLSSFNTWYSNGGSSSPTFVINQDYNLGPFTNRSEYLVFNEISDFEVLNY